MNCLYCNNICIKKGVRKAVQKWFCKVCGKWQQDTYKNGRVTNEKIASIVEHNRECNGISSISRLVKLSKATVQRVIVKYGVMLKKPELGENDEEYEVDELCTYVGNKRNLVWVMYAINKATREVMDLVIGKRTSENVSKIIGTLLDLKPKKIHTDRLNIYPGLVPAAIHRVKKYKTNHIERKNLDLRNCLKRLMRKTICYSKSERMLEACVKLCVWNSSLKY